MRISKDGRIYFLYDYGSIEYMAELAKGVLSGCRRVIRATTTENIYEMYVNRDEYRTITEICYNQEV